MMSRMTAVDAARDALIAGELNAEMGVPVSWSEVRALHDVIRDLLAYVDAAPDNDEPGRRISP